MEGMEEKDYEFVANLLAEKSFSDAQIAALANVTSAFVEKVKAELTTKKN